MGNVFTQHSLHRQREREREKGKEGDYVKEVASAAGGWKCSE
jgi:hypothetical protein